MQMNVRLAAGLIALIGAEFVGMRWMAQTWIAGGDAAPAPREASAPAADPVPTTENQAEPVAAPAAPAADWHASDGWGGQAAASQNGAASGAQSAAGLSATGAPVQAAVQASMQPQPQAPAAQPSPAAAPSASSNTSRNAGP